ncbi:MAG: flagellar biosynthetic protein FliO [Desulfobacterium sp.]|nr:flagellar biosynthetic protein FliO [Desulfobacterium sp.]
MELGGYFQSLTIIFVILGFLGLVLWGIKRYGARFGFNRFHQDRDLCLEDHISLGPKRDACVIRYKDKRFLLGVTDHGISLLSVLDNDKKQGE